MPAVDPLSATARPFVAHEFRSIDRANQDTTLRKVDQNSLATREASPSHVPKARVYKDTLPSPNNYVPPYTHLRSASSASVDHQFDRLTLEPSSPRAVAAVGSDEWMGQAIGRCLEAARPELDIKGQGLETLSTRIAELGKVVTLVSSASPLSSPRPRHVSPGGPSSPNLSPVPPANETISPGAGPYSANSRPFARAVSAPASALALGQFNGARSIVDRQPSRLRVNHALLDSPTLTETSEEGTETVAPVRTALAGPSLPPNFGSGVHGERTRVFGRSKTGVGISVNERLAKEISINAAQNALKSLPSALFEIANLTSLTLRSNRLTRLPAAIGELHNLRELNIGNNKITELPATILGLEKLVNFLAHPNHWLQPTESTSYHGRKLGPLHSRQTGNVPRLFDLCANVLMTPRPPADIPPFLEVVDWNPEQSGEPHPLLDLGAMQSRMPYLSADELRRVVQSARSASNAASQNTRTATSTFVAQARHSLFPSTHSYAAPDDAADNPYYHPCPSRRHQIFDSDSNALLPPSRRLFLHAAEERVEWKKVHGQSDLPVRWLGCSPGCLAFLEDEPDEEDELWGLSDDDNA